MARRRKQNNAYEVSLSDGRTITAYGPRYSTIQNGAKAFGINAVAVQRVYKSGKRGSRKGV